MDKLVVSKVYDITRQTDYTDHEDIAVIPRADVRNLHVVTFQRDKGTITLPDGSQIPKPAENIAFEMPDGSFVAQPGWHVEVSRV